MVVHPTVVQKGIEDSCGTSEGTDDSMTALGDVSRVGDRCRSPSLPTMARNENRHVDRNHSKCPNGRRSRNAGAAENAAATMDSSERVGPPPAAKITTVPPLSTTTAPHAHISAGAAAGGQRVGSIDHGAIGTASHSRPRAALGARAPPTESAPLTWRGPFPSPPDPSLCLAIISPDAVDAVATPTPEGAAAEVHSPSAVSVPLHMSDTGPQPGDNASPLWDSVSSRNSVGAAMASLAHFEKPPTPTLPPHSLAALPLSSLLDASPSPQPALPPMPHHQRHPDSRSARRTTPVPMVKEGDGGHQELGEDLPPWHGRLHVSLGSQANSSGCFCASGRFSSAVCSPLLSVCSGGNGNLSCLGSPTTGGLPARPGSPTFLCGAGPPSKSRLLEARFLSAGTSSTQSLDRPPVPPAPGTGAGATASSNSLSLLSPLSAVLASFSNDSGHNHRSGDGAGAGGGRFPSPRTLRSPFASVLAPKMHHHNDSAAVSPRPCFFHRPASPSSFFASSSPPFALSAAAADYGPLPAPSSQPTQRGGAAVVTSVSPASAPSTAARCALYVSSPLESISSASAACPASPSSANAPWSSRSLASGTGQSHRSPPALLPSAPHFLSPSWPLPAEAVSKSASSSMASAPIIVRNEGRGDALSVSAPQQRSGSGAPPPTLTNEAGGAETEQQKWNSRPADGHAIGSHGNYQHQQQQHRPHSQLRQQRAGCLSGDGVLTQPVVQLEAWHVLSVSGSGSGSVDNCEDDSTEVRGANGEQSASVASPAESATVPQSPQQTREREVPREVVVAWRVSDRSRDATGSEANSHRRDRRTDDATKPASAGDDNGAEDEVTGSKDEHSAQSTRCRCRRSRNGGAAQHVAAALAPAARPLRPMSPHNWSSSSASPRGRNAEAQEEDEVAAMERAFSVLISTAPHTADLALSINGSSGPHVVASVRATAAAPAADPMLTAASHFRLSSFAALRHGKTSAAPEPEAAAAAAALGVEAEAFRAPPPPPFTAPSSDSPSLLAAPERGAARDGGTPNPPAERLSVSSVSCASSLSLTHRKPYGRAVDSRTQATCGATQALATASTAFYSQAGVSSRSNSSLGSRLRASPLRGNARSRRTSSVTIIGVVADGFLAVPARGAASRASDPAAAGSELWSAATASTPMSHRHGTPISSVAVSPLAELLLSSPSASTGGSGYHQAGSDCDGDIRTPDMAAAAAAAVLRLHRQRPNPTPLCSTAPVLSPEKQVATPSPEDNAATENNAPTSTVAAAVAVVAALGAASRTQPTDTSAPSPRGIGNGSSRLLRRTSSSLARAVAEALRRRSLADNLAGGGVPLHNLSPRIPSLLVSSAHAWPATAAAPTTVARLGETGAQPLQRTPTGEPAAADPIASPRLHTSVVSTEAVMVHGDAVEGAPHLLKRPKGD
ncbi:hypothetical protein LSCM1_08075 [Leishmania martiniquensis]|uniref:Uncharacterized protein n=1 Tax=Leishmania martiniquensis TaxID=1580590 RepID=A0A836H6H7_9TRYP|nr:hypothetical protein LSCM1_08075 [Leishmania martiniquensis]